MLNKRDVKNVCRKDGMSWGLVALSGIGLIIAAYVLSVIFGLFPEPNETVYRTTEALNPWSDLQYNERGDFLAGFLSAIAVIGAVAAVILQSKALQEQRKEMIKQSEIFSQQLDIFKTEQHSLEKQFSLQQKAYDRDLLDRKVTAFRESIPAVERQLIPHAKMIRQHADKDYDRALDLDFTEATIFETINALKAYKPKEEAQSGAKHLLDRLCSYRHRIDRMRDRAGELDDATDGEMELKREFSYYLTYSSFGQLSRQAGLTRKKLTESGCTQGYNYAFDEKASDWVKVKSGDAQE